MRIFLMIVTLFLITCLTLNTPKPIDSVEIIDTEQADVVVILVQGEITDDTYTEFHKALNDAYKDGIRKAVIFLNSNGGDVDAGADMIADITRFNQMGGKISTAVTNDSICMSMCTVVFASGDTRYTGQDAIWLFHSPRTGSEESKNVLKRLISRFAIDSAREYSMEIIAWADKDFAEVVRPYIYADDLDKELTLTGTELLKVSTTYAQPLP